MSKLRFGAGIWHFATYVDRYATDGYGEPRDIGGERPDPGADRLIVFTPGQLRS